MRTGAWQGRDVFVTGHTGLKGAWLCLLLERLGAQVHGYALDPQPGCLFRRAGVSELVATDGRGDIRDTGLLSDALKASGADVVLHLAAQSVVRESYRDPTENFSTNVMGTLSVLEAALSVPAVTSVVSVTTDKVYRNNEWLWAYRETEPLGGDDPYSASKACAELVTHAMASSFPREGLGIATARAGNVVAGGDTTADALIPELVGSFATGRPAALRNPQAVRPWQHALEPLAGYLTLAEHLPGHAHGRGWNFGPSAEDVHTVGDVADLLASLWGEGASWAPTGEKGPHEAGLLLLDSTLARQELGWRPVLDTRQALAWTVEWEHRVRAGDSPLDVSRVQVDRFVEAAQ